MFEFSRSYVILTIWWPRSGVRIYQIVTGVTSVVGVPSTHLVFSLPFSWLIVQYSLDISWSHSRDHSGYMLSQWEMALHSHFSNTFHWLRPYPGWSVHSHARNLTKDMSKVCGVIFKFQVWPKYQHRHQHQHQHHQQQHHYQHQHTDSIFNYMVVLFFLVEFHWSYWISLKWVLKVVDWISLKLVPKFVVWISQKLVFSRVCWLIFSVVSS